MSSAIWRIHKKSYLCNRIECQKFRANKAHWQTTMLGAPASSGIARYWTLKRVPTVSG